jgi:nitroreductase
METLAAIAARRSVRSFRRGAAIAAAELLRIVDAGRLAPTARNEQPWEFVVVTDRDTLSDLGKLADHGRFIADASACIAVFAQPTKYYVEDGSAATTQMLLAATALGVASCWVAGDKKGYAIDIGQRLGAPPELKLVSLIALGYAADVTAAPKRGLRDVTHWNGYGQRPPT